MCFFPCHLVKKIKKKKIKIFEFFSYFFKKNIQNLIR